MESEIPERKSMPTQEQEAIGNQIARMFKSSQFGANERRRAFLNYIVEETLAGRADRLKGYSIGVSVLGRSEDFDATSDPVVRLEARRLRRELEHYYLTDGSKDALVITIPKGSYVPSFEFREVSSTPPGGKVGENTFEKSGWQAPNWLVLLLLALLIGVSGFLVLESFKTQDQPVDHATTDNDLWGDLPIVAVMPFNPLGSSAVTSVAARGIAEDITTDLARVQGLRVISYASTAGLSDESIDLIGEGRKLGATHVLRGSLQTMTDGYRLNIGLVDVGSRSEIWAKRFDYKTAERFDTQTEISREISSTFSIELFPELTSRIEDARWTRRDARILYQQALDIIHPPSDPSRFDAAQALLQRVVRLEPDAPHGHAGLAFAESHRTWFGLAPNTDETRDLIKHHADSALEMDPASVRALLTLGILEILKGNPKPAIEFGERAVEHEPSSSLAQAYLGMFLLYAGKPEQAITPLKRSLSLDPLNIRRPYRNILGVSLYHAGQFQESLDTLQENLDLGGPFGPHMMVYQAANNAALGQFDEEEKILNSLSAMMAEGESFPLRWWLERVIYDPTMMQPLLDEYEKAKLLADAQ
ncbi:tetratricopeptide repeat protein [Ruegeria sp. Ofav3-42]|uniref:tetratricopeptide repeat protein n=1 Tax=Ruegeria sp. Ofav3-42 TaxID=2917759 RepID=UPI001EF44531|nr:tetratricopeptide repeat protein [Ruegeria sp. Ofav3-42]MCG7521782.1 tetratricopeptide repeat protein [Ruegeria sp. Ofav3-42]